jgi:4-hydroxy-3-methylbut-2-enyl diphosphate reductase
MKVILAKKAGFCMGVRRAVDATLETVQNNTSPVATYGPLIHNPQVLDLLQDRGVEVLHDLPRQREGVIIIRAHGVPPEHKKRLSGSGAVVRDATCPRVMKVQAIIKKHKSRGCFTVIVGDKDHAEVVGLMGYGTPDVAVVSSPADVETLSIPGKYIIVCQTTQDKGSFDAICQAVTEKFPDGEIFNTICDSTDKRQTEVRNLCGKVDAVVVVGGKFSANTKRLAVIAEAHHKPVFLVETEDDLDIAKLRDFDVIGVTAGASTPTWMINRVIRSLEIIPGKDQSVLVTFLQKIMWVLLATNLYAAGAGGVLGAVFAKVLGGSSWQTGFLISFGYLFAMHNINRYADKHVKKFNDPIVEQFCKRYCPTLMGISFLLLILSASLVYSIGMAPFLLFLAMALFGITYGNKIFPESFSTVFKIKRLKEIPGSKTFLVASAWSLIIILLPNWVVFKPYPFLLLMLMLVIAIYCRTSLFDVFDVQGDRIVGKETLPVCIGEEKTLLFLTRSLYALGCLAVLPYMAGYGQLVTLLFLPFTLYLLLLIHLYKSGRLVASPRLEFVLESALYVLGLSQFIVFL